MVLLAQILEDAVEDELRPENPARAKRLRVRVPKPNRTFLEIDQLVALLDAARKLEQSQRRDQPRTQPFSHRPAFFPGPSHESQIQAAFARVSDPLDTKR